MRHLLEIQRNAEGSKLAYMSPLNEKTGQSECGYRIAGPKPWGGSTVLESVKISDEDLIRYIKEYAPHLIAQLYDKT